MNRVSVGTRTDVLVLVLAQERSGRRAGSRAETCCGCAMPFGVGRALTDDESTRPSKAWVLISFFLFNCSQITLSFFFRDEKFVNAQIASYFLASDPSAISSKSMESTSRDEARMCCD